ncbi:hypothetical protein EPUL_004464, partial [Erysiphe pulchra]
MEDETESFISTEEFPLLPKETTIEINSRIGADFLAMLADGALLAMRRECVYSNTSVSTDNRHQARQATWAKKAESQDAGIKVFNFKRQILKASAPQGQSKEDRWVMIRLGPEHEARKSEAFKLQQKIKELVSDKSLMECNSRATRKWTNIVIGPIQKRVMLDGMQDPMEGLLQEELATVRDFLPIRYMNWTRKSQNDEPYGNIRICLPEAKANKFPSRLRIFGEDYVNNATAFILPE